MREETYCNRIVKLFAEEKRGDGRLGNSSKEPEICISPESTCIMLMMLILNVICSQSASFPKRPRSQVLFNFQSTRRNKTNKTQDSMCYSTLQWDGEKLCESEKYQIYTAAIAMEDTTYWNSHSRSNIDSDAKLAPELSHVGIGGRGS